MKIALEDSDVEKIAAAVAAKVGAAAGKGKPAAGKGKPSSKDKADEGEGGEDDDFSGEAGGDAGEGDDSFGDDAGAGGGEEVELTREDVRAALKLVSKKFDGDTAMEVLRKAGGVASLSTLKEAKFEAVIEAAKKKAKAK